jgi:hypothetical protein
MIICTSVSNKMTKVHSTYLLLSKDQNTKVLHVFTQSKQMGYISLQYFEPKITIISVSCVFCTFLIESCSSCLPPAPKWPKAPGFP